MIHTEHENVLQLCNNMVGTLTTISSSYVKQARVAKDLAGGEVIGNWVKF